ncbi:related to cytochrome P450 CYP2 subfamily [Armillaria ostoyae]|uniref:Related to cytochrome P450 CYP2 subfamily n=1 Tax=Armillaria ostoyae TaxID=47428 RepID=A0A284QTG7_ARMOS|nr:related to cytochrome P450 CYP2 subfamily [Armillaria ostoyae]
MSFLYFLDFFLFVAGIYFVRRLLSKRRSPLPPGPRGYPIIGNVLDMPTDRPWLTFTQWGDKWGDVCSVSMFGQSIIVLNSHRAAYALLDKRSAIYSERPKLVMAGDLMGWNDIIGLAPYGETFRAHRKLLHSVLGSKSAIRTFYPMEEQEAQSLMKRLLDSPERLHSHISQDVAALVLRITYGYEVEKEEDDMVALVNRAMEELSVASSPGQFLVDIIPILRYVPEWFPGAGFQLKAKQWAQDLRNMVNVPYEMVKRQAEKGEAPECFVSNLLQGGGSVPEHDLKWAAGAIYAAGADTTVAVLDTFFLLMMLYPDVQKKAQSELDSVLGGDRLPTFDDRDDLPYVNALCKELVRFYPVAPIAIPHATLEDDVFEGHFIPKGSVVFPNIWAMAHDPEVYKDPDTFNPDRFLGPSPEQDPREISFGFGRRSCPGTANGDKLFQESIFDACFLSSSGRLLAQATTYIVCAMALSTFDISKVKGDKPVFSPSHGSVSHPAPFKCNITPRSMRAVELITRHE